MSPRPAVDERWPAFLEIARGTEPTQAAFEFIASLADELIGSKLTTATVFDVPAGRLRRVYSQNTTAYAVGGYKQIPDNKWTETLIVRQQSYVALTIEAIAEDFFDWELIRSLGCESIANLPVVVGGDVIGAINLLNGPGHYTQERLEHAAKIMPFAAFAFLLASQETAGA